MKNAFVIAAVSALVTATGIKAAPAFAEAPPAVSETRISYVRIADLDLSTQAGRRTLDVRIAQAAREVCGRPSDVDLVGQNRARQCRHDVIERAAGEREALLAAAQRGAVIALTASR